MRSGTSAGNVCDDVGVTDELVIFCSSPLAGLSLRVEGTTSLPALSEGAADGGSMTDEESEEIRERLRSLGYLG